jgi:hypothetical protein
MTTRTTSDKSDSSSTANCDECGHGVIDERPVRLRDGILCDECRPAGHEVGDMPETVVLPRTEGEER